MMSDGREVGRGRAFVSLVIHASFFDIPPFVSDLKEYSGTTKCLIILRLDSVSFCKCRPNLGLKTDDGNTSTYCMIVQSSRKCPSSSPMP
jgi:hypothetical protein